eukprot:420662_1
MMSATLSYHIIVLVCTSICGLSGELIYLNNGVNELEKFGGELTFNKAFSNSTEWEYVNCQTTILNSGYCKSSPCIELKAKSITIRGQMILSLDLTNYIDATLSFDAYSVLLIGSNRYDWMVRYKCSYMKGVSDWMSYKNLIDDVGTKQYFNQHFSINDNGKCDHDSNVKIMFAVTAPTTRFQNKLFLDNIMINGTYKVASSTSKDSPQSESSNTGEIVGIVIGVVIAILIAIIFAYYCGGGEDDPWCCLKDKETERTINKNAMTTNIQNVTHNEKNGEESQSDISDCDL